MKILNDKNQTVMQEEGLITKNMKTIVNKVNISESGIIISLH